MAYKPFDLSGKVRQQGDFLAQATKQFQPVVMLVATMIGHHRWPTTCSIQVFMPCGSKGF